MNKVILHGRLARDVDLRTTASGKSVAQVNIAVNRRGKDQGADFIPLVIWGAVSRNLCPLFIQRSRGISRGPYAGEKL